MGGALTYLKNLLRLLPKLRPDYNYIVCVAEVIRDELAAFCQQPNVTLRSFYFAKTSGIKRFYFDQLTIPKLIRTLNVDVLFSATGFGTIHSPCPQVVLVRNATYFSEEFFKKYKELKRPLIRKIFLRWWSLQSIKASNVILFPTAAMQEIVKRHVPLDHKYTEVIHYGFDREGFFGYRTAEPEIVERTRIWKSQGYRILLNVSTYAVQKNFETLINALPYLIRQGIKLKLILTISREDTSDKVEYDLLMQRIKDLGLEEFVILIGYVPYEKLAMVYRAADIFIFPSLTESFGHPLVEAIASGLPIISADVPYAREVCQDTALYFDVFNEKDLAEKLEVLIGNKNNSLQLKEKALKRSKHFSWEKHASKLLEIFAEIYKK